MRLLRNRGESRADSEYFSRHAADPIVAWRALEAFNLYGSRRSYTALRDVSVRRATTDGEAVTVRSEGRDGIRLLPQSKCGPGTRSLTDTDSRKQRGGRVVAARPSSLRRTVVRTCPMSLDSCALALHCLSSPLLCPICGSIRSRLIDAPLTIFI